MVENRRVADGRVVPRQVLYLGEINDAQYAGWCRSIAVFDGERSAAAQAALGRPMAAFCTPNDDPTLNASADAIFLRNRLRD